MPASSRLEVSFATENIPLIVKAEEIVELHYIVPIKNVASIKEHGILSHNRAAKLTHADISMAEIQDRREKAGARRPALHDYANLYFNGRNKMMAKKRPEHDYICVLRVAPAVLNIPGL